MTTVGATAQELLFTLRLAVATITGAILATASLPRKLDLHEPLATQVVAYAVLVVLLLMEVGFLTARRDWGVLRLPALLLALGASALSSWTLRPELLTTSADWSFGTTGWVAVTILFNRPLLQLACFLTLHEAVTVVRVITMPTVSEGFALNLVAGSVGTVGFPLACGIAAAAVRNIADAAERASIQASAIRTAEAVAEGLHALRRERLTQLDRTTEPVLQALAEGLLPPDAPATQRLCAVEAARLRRLLAETDLVDDPLLHELRHGADVAERRGVLIELDTAGTWHAPGLDVRRALIDGPMAVLSTAHSHAHVSVIGTPGQLSVNVVADGVGWAAPPATHPEVTHTLITNDDTIWIEARWTHPSLSS